MSKSNTKRLPTSPLDEARAALLLRRINDVGTPLNQWWYESLRSDGIAKAGVDRVLNLLAERGRIRLSQRDGRVVAIRVPEAPE